MKFLAFSVLGKEMFKKKSFKASFALYATHTKLPNTHIHMRTLASIDEMHKMQTTHLIVSFSRNTKYSIKEQQKNAFSTDCG